MSKTINTILNLTDKFTPKLTAAGKSALLFKQQLKNCNTVADSIDRGLATAAAAAVSFGVAATAAVGAFTVSSLKTYKEFEQSMSNVAGILDISRTSEDYARLEAAAREAGKTTTKTATEAANALSYMALAGWNTEDSITGLMPILRASQATGDDLATTSDLVTDSMSALGISVNDLEHYLDICAKAQNNSNTTLTELLEAYIKVGGTLQNFNVGLEESGALLGLLASRGIKGSEAGTALQSVLINLTRKSGQSYKAMEALGMSAYDADGNFKGYAETLKDLNAALEGMTEEERNNYLSLIGGKQRMTALNDLLLGIDNVTETGVNEFEDLKAKLEDCDGALENMARTMTDNLAGNLAIAQSALTDFKIEIGEELSPYVNQVLKWFAEELPDATEKLGTWLSQKLPKAARAGKDGLDSIISIAKTFADNINVVLASAAGLVVGLKAFSIATRVATFFDKLSGKMKALTTVQKLATVAQTLFNTSLLACPVTWVAVGVAALAGGFAYLLLETNKLKQERIDSHFGDIALSAEECEEMVNSIFGSDLINQASTVNSALETANQDLENIYSSAQNLNKMNFRISMGDEVDKDAYLDEVSNYINSVQEGIRDRQYSLKLQVDFLFGEDTEAGENFNNATSGSYTKMYEAAEQLGTNLQEAVLNAYENGWDIDSTNAVDAILNSYNDITKALAEAEGMAKLELFKSDFEMSDLTKDSFDNYMSQIDSTLSEMGDEYKKAQTAAIASAAYSLSQGDITQDEYNNLVDSATTAYKQDMADLDSTGLAAAQEAITSVMRNVDGYDSMVRNLNTTTENGLNSMAEKLASGKEITDKDLIEYEERLRNTVINSSVNQFDLNAMKGTMNEYYETMQPYIEERRRYAEELGYISEEEAETLNQLDLIGAIAGNEDALKSYMANSLSELGPEQVKKIQEGGEKYTEYFNVGLLSRAETVYESANTIRDTAAEILEEPLSVITPVQIALQSAGIDTSNVSCAVVTALNSVISTAYSYGSSGDTNAEIDTDGEFATGTTYFGGGVARINENGGEIVNLPTGTSVIPADKSDKIVSGLNLSTFNVNVYVQGNIFGTEDAVNIIGDGVCERVVDIVMAM